MTTEWIHSFVEAALGLAELNHRWLQVAQWTFHKAILLFVMSEEVMPEGMLATG